MKPQLEQLEERCTPSDFNTYGYDLQRIGIPAQIVDPFSQLLWVRMGTWLGTSALGQRLAPGAGYHWSPNRVFVVDETPAQAWAWGLPNTTGRELMQVGNYLQAPSVFLPVAFASPGTDYPGSDGIGWELDSFWHGWWPVDWGGAPTPSGTNYSHNLMPPGPTWGQFGQYANTFVNRPNYALADAVFAAEVFGGNTSLPPWWYFA